MCNRVDLDPSTAQLAGSCAREPVSRPQELRTVGQFPVPSTKQLAGASGVEEMKRMVVVASLLLAGCVSVGTNYSETAAAQLQPGMTRSQVVGLLGKPNSVVTLGDGRVQLGWVHSQGSMFGAKAKSLTLPFSADGRLLQVPGGAPVEGPPAVATTSTARVGTFSSTIDTTATTSLSGGASTAAALPPGVQQLGSNIWLYPAPTPSGKCIEAPADYQGTGSATRPAITPALPRCSSSKSGDGQ